MDSLDGRLRKPVLSVSRLSSLGFIYALAPCHFYIPEPSASISLCSMRLHLIAGACMVPPLTWTAPIVARHLVAECYSRDLYGRRSITEEGTCGPSLTDEPELKIDVQPRISSVLTACCSLRPILSSCSLPPLSWPYAVIPSRPPDRGLSGRCESWTSLPDSRAMYRPTLVLVEQPSLVSSAFTAADDLRV